MIGRNTKGGRVTMSNPEMPPDVAGGGDGLSVRDPDADGDSDGDGDGESEGVGDVGGLGVGTPSRVKSACGLGGTLAKR
jgi:hypothetical protein